MNDLYRGKESIQILSQLVLSRYLHLNKSEYGNPQEAFDKFEPKFKKFIDILDFFDKKRLSEYTTSKNTHMNRADVSVTQGLLRVLDDNKDVDKYLEGFKDLKKYRPEISTTGMGCMAPEVFDQVELKTIGSYIEDFLKN